MGYACPVCETPQADGRHLANHLAFTAMIHDDDHEAWLTEHAPGWEEAGEHELAKRVAESATEIEFPPGEDDEREETVDAHGRDGHSHGAHEHDHGHSPGGGQGRNREQSRAQNRGPADVAIDTDIRSDSEGGDERDVAAIVAEARELTRRMRSGDDPTEDSGEEDSERESESGRDEDGQNEASEREERNGERRG